MQTRVENIVLQFTALMFIRSQHIVAFAAAVVRECVCAGKCISMHHAYDEIFNYSMVSRSASLIGFWADRTAIHLLDTGHKDVRFS